MKSVSLGLWNIVHLPFTLHIALYPGDGVCASTAPNTPPLWVYDTTFTSPTGPISGAVSGVFTFNVPEAVRPYMETGQLYTFSFSGIHSYVEDNPNDYNHGWYVSSPVCGGAGTNDPMPGGGTYGYLPVGPTWTSGCVSNYHIAFNTVMGEIPGLSVGPANSCGIKTLTSNIPSGSSFPIGTTNVVYTVTNMAGATATCNFPVTVNLLRTLNLSLFLEGLYKGANSMKKAQNGISDQFQADTADVITVEIHNPPPFSEPPVFIANKVKLDTTGKASFILPCSYDGSYYVTIKHRNSVGTTTALPLDFSGATVNYSFDTPSKAYSSNLSVFSDNVAAIFAGDENQDTIIDATDINDIYNLVILFPSGYIDEDVNGDGIVDGTDLNITNNNNEAFVRSWAPWF